MSRGLTSGQISALEANNYQVEDHIKIVTRNLLNITFGGGSGSSTTYRYTTGALDTVVSGDGTYVPASYIREIVIPEETFEISPQTINIVFERFDQPFIDDITTDTQNGTLVQVYKVLLDTSTRAISGRFLMFDGNVSGVDINGNRSTQAVILRCSSSFYQFNVTNGRQLNDIGDNPKYEAIFWGGLKV